MKKISVINQPLNNRGDQAAHRAFIRILNEHDFEISVLFLGYDQAVKCFSEGIEDANYICFDQPSRIIQGIARFFVFFPFLYKFAEFLPGYDKFCHNLKSADMVVCAPGGANMGVYKAWGHLENLFMALENNENVSIWGRSIGPFLKKTYSDKLFFRRSCSIMDRMGFMALRDQKSQEIISSLNYEFIKTIDTAFAYTPEMDLPGELSYLINEKYIVFIPHKLYDWHPLFNKVDPKVFNHIYLEIIKKISSKGYKIVMLPQLFNLDKEGDYRYFEYLKQQVSSDIDLISVDYDSDVQQAIIKNAKALIGARYHSIIFAINNITPFLSLSYEHKMYGMLRILELSDYSLDLLDIIENKDTKSIFKAIDKIIEDSQKIEIELKEKRRIAKGIVFDAFSEFLKYAKNIKTD